MKHIAPYLPYGLIFRTSKHQFKYGETHNIKMTGASIDRTGALNVEFTCFDDLYFSNSMNTVYPLLKPLSSITRKELELEGFRAQIDFITREIHTGDDRFDKKEISYNIIEYCFKNHYDYFGLIEKGLALDLNLNK